MQEGVLPPVTSADCKSLKVACLLAWKAGCIGSLDIGRLQNQQRYNICAVTAGA